MGKNGKSKNSVSGQHKVDPYEGDVEQEARKILQEQEDQAWSEYFDKKTYGDAEGQASS